MNRDMNDEKIELLAPAGNMECLKTALYFGADAVYMAGQSYGLRAFADNFSDEQLSEAVQLTHNENIYYGEFGYVEPGPRRAWRLSALFERDRSRRCDCFRSGGN